MFIVKWYIQSPSGCDCLLFDNFIFMDTSATLFNNRFYIIQSTACNAGYFTAILITLSIH